MDKKTEIIENIIAGLDEIEQARQTNIPLRTLQDILNSVETPDAESQNVDKQQPTPIAKAYVNSQPPLTKC